MISNLATSLTLDWYFAVVQGCGLNPQTFQLMQGSTAVGSTSEGLWFFFDAVPPESLNHYYNPGGSNVFSQQYGTMLFSLQPVPVVKMASDLWSRAGGLGTVKAYNRTIQDLQNALAGAPSVRFIMTSGKNAELTDASRRTAGTWTSKIELPPPASRTAAMDAPSAASSVAGITISAAFKHLTTFVAAPLSSASSDPHLSRFPPWYDSAAMTTAYLNPSSGIWTGVPPTWTDFFAPNGALPRICSAVVAIDGIDIIITSDDAAVAEELASTGFCPGLRVDAAGSKGRRIYAPPGNPFIFGVNVMPIGQAIR